MNPPHPPVVSQVVHWRIAQPLRAGPPQFEQRVQWLGRLIGDQVRQVSGDAPPGALLLSTTCLSALVLGGASNRSMFLEAILWACGRRPSLSLQAYQCAGWAFALRWGALHLPAQPRGSSVICIADMDLLRMPAMHTHPSVGRYGFGITSIRVDAFGSPGAVVCQSAPGGLAFRELISALRKEMLAAPCLVTHLPFLTPERSALARKLVGGGERLAADHHADYGHCFGSDAWIGVIRSSPPGQVAGAARRLSAISNNGHFAYARVEFAPALRCELAEI